MWIIYHFLRLACAKEWTSFNEQFNRIDSQFVIRIAPKWQAKQAKYMQKENSTQTCLMCQYQSKVDSSCSNYKLLTDHTQNRTKYLHWTERKENEAVEKNVVSLLSKTFRSGRKHALRKPRQRVCLSQKLSIALFQTAKMHRLKCPIEANI